jgi:hypothetical protein
MLRYVLAVGAILLVGVALRYQPTTPDEPAGPLAAPEAVVEGEVTVDGVPLPYGMLLLESPDRRLSAPVRDGRFELRLAPVGPVRFTLYTPTPTSSDDGPRRPVRLYPHRSRPGETAVLAGELREGRQFVGLRFGEEAAARPSVQVEAQ